MQLKIARVADHDWACHTSQVIAKMANLPDCHQNQSLGADGLNAALIKTVPRDAYEQYAAILPNYWHLRAHKSAYQNLERESVAF